MIFEKLYQLLAKQANVRAIIILFLLAHSVLLCMLLFTFPSINAQLGQPAFDLQTFGYSIEQARTMLGNLDNAHQALYIFPQLFLLDILYPALLSLFLSVFIIRLNQLIFPQSNQLYSTIYLFPFSHMLFDYVENIFIYTMITIGSEVSASIIQASSIFTLLKGIFTTFSWIIILVLIGLWLKKKYF